MDKLEEAAAMLTGTHNFTAFTKPKTLIEESWRNPVKTMLVKVNNYLLYNQ